MIKKISIFFISLGLILFALSCQTQSESNLSQGANLDAPISPTPPKRAEAQKTEFVDVPNLADKPAEKFDEIFGAPRETTKITDNPAIMPGEYRLYDVAGHPKGLSVRFYKNQAKRFNLLLGTPRKSSKDALLELFKIDVSKMKSVKGEPLSEKWQGDAGGIKFETAYAKREKPNGDFTMVHAEIGK